MKKVWILMMLICVAALFGCGAGQTFETISDDISVFAPADACEIQLSIPEAATVPVMEGDDGSKIYLCDSYTVTLQTLEGGDIGKTFREISGYGKDDLTVMKTTQNGTACYESAWCAAGEGGDQTCRAVILDDGTYHYAVTVMANYAQAGALSETWEGILDSVSISTD